MKKLFIFLAAAGLMASTSCTRDDSEMTGSGSEGIVTLSARLPQQLQTRSMGDGLTATKLTYAVYEAGAKTPLLTSESDGAPVVEFNDLQAQLTLRLATGRSYDVLFWADAFGQKDDANPYKVDFEAQSVTVDYDAALSNDESRDAFFGTIQGMEVTSATSQEIVLTRPFAQINVGTDDLAVAAQSGLQTDALQTEMQLSNVPTMLNLMDGTTSGSANVTFAANAIPTEQLTVSGKTYDYLAMNYLLIGADKTTTNIAFTFSDGATTSNRSFSNVPVQRNYRTNIVGSVLTQGVDFDIEIDPGFEEPDHNLAALLMAAENGGSVTLTESVELPRTLTVPAGKKLTVDLGGQEIRYTGTSTGGAIDVYGELEIRGEGVVDGGSNATVTAVAAMGANAKVTIYGGTYKVGADNNGEWNDCIYAYNGGEITIYGGHFESAVASPGGIYTVLNVNNSKPGAITVYGGEFVNYDPATGDDAGTVSTFVAEGYSSVKTGENPDTWQVIEGAGAATAEELKEAVAAGEPVITLVKDIALTEVLSFNKDVTLVADGDVTLTGAPVYFNGANTTVRGIHFANGTSSSGNASAVYVTSQKCRTLSFEDCTFTNAQWDAIQLTDKDIESVSITNCTFRNTVEGGYRYIHLELRNGSAYYANAEAKVTITGCTFENVSSTYCKDSAVTLCGFSHENLTIENNVVKGDGADNITNSMFWICNGTNFGDLFSAETLKSMFRYEA